MHESFAKTLAPILGRRSLRTYEDREVSADLVAAMLEAAMAAPAAVARDPWRFIVLHSREVRERVAEGLPHGKMLGPAGVGFVVAGELAAAHDGQLSYLLQDCSAAIENLLLAAHGLGLGACWVGIHPSEDSIGCVKKMFSLPPPIVPIAAIALGLPGETLEPRTRYNPEFVRYGKW
jgi:nitroreductase